SLSHQPLFQAMFIFNNAPLPAFHLPGLTVQGLDWSREAAKFDLTFVMLESEGALKGFCDYSTDLFDETTITRLVAHFRTLLENIVANPNRALDELPILSGTEQQQLLIEWNNTRTAYSTGKPVHQLFEEQVLKSPDAIALICDAEQVTYAELNRRANRLARYLKQLGVGPDVMVGLLVERSVEWVIGLLAIFKAGGAHVSLDPEYPQDRLSYMVADAGAPVLLTMQRLLRDSVNQQVQQDIGRKVRIVSLDADANLIERMSEQNLVSDVSADNAAYVVYTSGSTGRPKGVVNTHGSLLNLLFWHRRVFQVTAADRASQVASMGFDASVWELWPYLTCGASVRIMDTETRLSPDKVRQWLAENEITIGWLPPVLAESLLVEKDLSDLSLRILLAGSDKLRLHPSDSTSFTYFNTYGPTEAAVISTYGIVPPQSEKSGLPSIGQPIENTEIYILDHLLQPVPVGVCGDLYIGGDGLSRGYLGQPALTAEKFIPNPFGSAIGERLYRTGDLARYLESGNIEFMGRSDAQIKIHGFRIELGEIETLLSGHPGVNAAAVTVQEDSPLSKRLVAYVVPQNDYEINSDDLRGFLRQRLPEYMLPAAFASIASLPLSPNGKVDRRALPKFDISLAASAADYAPPRTAVEAELVELWRDLLNLDRISIHHSFFAAGGHSLLATQLAFRIREAFGIELPLREIFESPTVAGLAAAIERSRQTNGKIEPARIQAVPRGARTLDELIEELNQLSEAEAQSLLATQVAA
ncbi:MAG: amino acid adenylation domain-containing protein, partial [Acidobacteriota bacterium]